MWPIFLDPEIDEWVVRDFDKDAEGFVFLADATAEVVWRNAVRDMASSYGTLGVPFYQASEE